MNQLHGHISELRSSKHMEMVTIDINGIPFSALTIKPGNEQEMLAEGMEVAIYFKENEVVLARDWSGQISMRNHLQGHVTKVEQDDVLSAVEMKTPCGVITSIITSGSADRLNLHVGSEVTAMIKTNEIILRPAGPDA